MLYYESIWFVMAKWSQYENSYAFTLTILNVFYQLIFLFSHFSKACVCVGMQDSSTRCAVCTTTSTKQLITIHVV